jgi:uncharacterized membrane protein
MTLEVWGMLGAGIATLVAGLILVRSRFQAASGVDKVLVLAPVFEAAPLAIFAMEHLLAAHDLMGAVPKWLPGPLFWVYFFGVALLAAAISFILWRCVRWSAALLALFFFLVVATVDLPNLAAQAHDRLFWTLTVRELCFGGGALVLAGSQWPREGWLREALIGTGRRFVALVMIFYGIEHFFFPRNVVGVPLEKMTPEWIPAPMVIAYFIGIILVVAGIGLFLSRTIRIAAAGAGAILVLLVIFFYGPIAVAELSTNPVEGLNYFGDTLLFAATVMLAGYGLNHDEAQV